MTQSSPMSGEMKIAVWRLILDHVHRATDVTEGRVERLRVYKLRLLKWINDGGHDPMPRPSSMAYKYHWSLYQKISAEMANHRT